MASFDLNFKAYGDKAILIEWPQRIDDEILDDISRMRDALTLSLRKSQEIVDVIAAYNSITIIHRHQLVNLPRRIEILKKIYAGSTGQSHEARYIYRIPVCYDSTVASDLEDYLKAQGIGLSELIQLHTDPIYRVCFFGFIPGFMYLSGLVPELHCPRKSTPSLQVKKGSVAIGGEQTGIYPSSSPGGWHVIGMSPIEFIGEQAGSLASVSAGDYIRFQSVSLDAYREIQSDVEAGKFELVREVINA